MRNDAREVRAQRRLPALERELPHGNVLARPLAGDRGADVERAGALEQRVDLAPRPSGPRLDELAADLRGDRLRALASAAVVHDDVRALRRELARARGADPARPPVTSTRLPARPVSTV